MTGKQRRYLRSLAHDMHPIVQIGKLGITDALVKAAVAALGDHELIKVALGHPEDGKHERAEEIATRCKAKLCGLIGHSAILYKPLPKDSKIKLPAAGTNQSF